MPDAPTVFVFDPRTGPLRRLVSVVEHIGFHPLPTSTMQEAIVALEEEPLVAALIAHCPEGVELCRYIGELTELIVPIAALIQEKEDREARTIATEMTADGYLRTPVTTSALETFLSVAGQLATMRERVREVERSLLETQSRLRQAAGPIGSSFHQFESVKDMLVVEVRRAKRYGYPLSILMVGLDPVLAVHEINRPSLQNDITGGLAVAIAKSIRGIDLPVQYAADRILVFLPHTDLAGAEEVGRRIKRRIKHITYRGDGMTVQLTASVGVAGISVGDTLTFSRLIRDAAAALRAAQLKGGDRVMKRIAGSSPG